LIKINRDARRHRAGRVFGRSPAVLRSFSGDGHLIHFAQTDAPLIVNHWAVSRDKGTYGRAAFGAAATVWGGASIDAAVTATVGRDGGQETGAHVGVRASF
jgi:hypothetical protein